MATPTQSALTTRPCHRLPPTEDALDGGAQRWRVWLVQGKAGADSGNALCVERLVLTPTAWKAVALRRAPSPERASLQRARSCRSSRSSSRAAGVWVHLQCARRVEPWHRDQQR
jgi:hypothetical protein